MIEVKTPLNEQVISQLHVGDQVFISGIVYVARDAAHKRMIQDLAQGKALPFKPLSQIIFYAGPTPAKPGEEIGVIGPTTAGRMDAYTIPLLEQGLKGMIAKGRRNKEVQQALVKHKAVYFVVTGGVAALLKRTVKQARVIAYADLGPEAIYELKVERLPVIVANDIYGKDIFDRT